MGAEASLVEGCFPVGGGETGALLRAYPWAGSLLGLPSMWPVALKVAVALVLNSPEPMFLAWGPDLLFFGNDAYRPILRVGAATATARPLRDVWSPAFGDLSSIVDCCRAGTSSRVSDVPQTVSRHGVERQTWWSFAYSSLYDETGAIAGLYCAATETTDWIEQRKAFDRLQASEASLETIVETVPVGILFAEAPSGQITRRNGRMDEIVGASSGTPKALADYASWVAYDGDGTPIAPRDWPLARVISGEVDDALLHAQYQRRDGRRVWIELACSSVRDAEGRLTGAVVAVSDIDARKTAEAMQSLMNHELSHRMKNLMAMVTAIANQTMRGATDLAAAREVLSERLIALSKAHDILLGGNTKRAPLETVVRSGVGVLDGLTADQFGVSGPDVDIGSSAGLSLAMMLHELSTNAAKYGALSVETGRVDIRWSIDDVADAAPHLRLEWIEAGGPPVVAPTRKGFGSRLIERGLAGAAKGSVAIDFAETGLRCRIEAPLAALQAGA